VTANSFNGKIAEVFINAGKSGTDTKAWTEAIGRVISLYLQSGGEVEKIIKTMFGIFGGQTIMKEGWILQSGPDALAKALTHLSHAEQHSERKSECPVCGEKTFISINGCGYCEKCFYSKCE
jgi:ribonucleoside-diphosphate reductase alpha chain